MNKINIKVWVNTQSGLPIKNKHVLCRLVLDEKNIVRDSVLFINDDGEWRTDDDCEISYAWNVVSWQSEVKIETEVSNVSDVELFLDHKENELALKNQQIELLENKIIKLKFAGSGLSNCCFNVSQSAGRILSEQDADSMKKAYERWNTFNK